jgi:hypothetical protein
VIVVLMLLRQRELRARVIRLLGHERLAETTRALDEAGLLWGLVAAAAAWPLVVAGVVAPKAAVSCSPSCHCRARWRRVSCEPSGSSSPRPCLSPSATTSLARYIIGVALL